MSINSTSTNLICLSHQKLFGVFALCSILFFFNTPDSFGLTESVELFGEINSVDLTLIDIWMEPENPKENEPVSIHSSVYNAGVVPSANVSDAVTIGYFVNGDLVEIDLLKNVLPGIENGVEISSGPIFDAIPGNYVVTVIINYHDTLSHLRDNPENNIVQKKFEIIGNIPSLINYDVHQYYDVSTNTQKIQIHGDIKNILQENVGDRNVVIHIGDIQKNTFTNHDGQFSLDVDMEFNDQLVEVTPYLEGDQFIPSIPQNIFPLKLDKEQSALALEIINDARTNNFENPLVEVALFQDSYDNFFKKITLDKLNYEESLIDNIFLTVLPANHEYIGEIYLEGRFLDAFQSDFVSNNVIKKEILISESAQVKFRTLDSSGKPQSNVPVENWVFTTVSGDDGFTDWIYIIPTVIAKEPYAAKAIFFGENVSWSDEFLIGPGEKKVIEIIQGDTSK